MSVKDYLKPGMVGVSLKKGLFDILGTFTTLAQGDTEASHVWRVRQDGTIATTGGKAGVLFDYVDPERYLKGRQFYLLETVDPLNASQLRIMDWADELIRRQRFARAYGVWKYAQLWAKAELEGSIDSLDPPAGKPPRFPICSQAVGFALWKAGVPVGKSQGKRDWSAVLPQTILQEAKQTRYSEAAGAFFPAPCMLLQTVQDEPFEG